jgi:Dna[CI] antecedent, DciA
MQKKPTQNKDFRTFRESKIATRSTAAMQKPRPVSELLDKGSNQLRVLRLGLKTRSDALVTIRSALPERLAAEVLDVGIADGLLTISASSAAWATRLRYVMAPMREPLAVALKSKIDSIKIRVARTQSL